PSWKKKRKKKGTRATCALRRLDHFVTPCFVPSPSDARHTRAANFLSRHVECVLSHTRNFQHFPCFINTYARSMHAGTRLAEQGRGNLFSRMFRMTESTIGDESRSASGGSKLVVTMLVALLAAAGAGGGVYWFTAHSNADVVAEDGGQA